MKICRRKYILQYCQIVIKKKFPLLHLSSIETINIDIYGN